MTTSSFDTLLSRLKSLPQGTTLQEALAAVGVQKPASAGEAQRRCALVRWFDESLYDFLCDGIGDKPPFTGFVEGGGVERLTSGRWELSEADRTRLLSEWQKSPTLPAWKQWNQKLGEYFLAHQGPDMQLEAVYHLAASPQPGQLVPLFTKWYAEADKRFDMAQCNALLQMLEVQKNFSGSELAQLLVDHHQFYEARLMFTDDYYKTGSYFHRDGALQELLGVLRPDNPAAPGPWIFHIHATGGTGKTMFLRSVITHELVPRRIPCARVDFDDFQLVEVRDQPTRLFVRVVEPWSRQVKSLVPLLERLNREERTPGWNTSVVNEVKRQLRGASIHTALVVILDTLEEATLSAADWLEDCIRSLREIHVELPQLKLVLSGRYDIATRSDALQAGEFVSYELPRFSDAEAHDYLQTRGVPAGEVRDAIVERSDASETEDEASPPGKVMTGRNPFKLAMFAELVLNRTNWTAKEIRELPSVNIGYLLERVIKRIPSQPVRWMVRYGAITRHLTFEFLDKVLMPPLRAALAGTDTDVPNRDLDQDYWTPEPQLAATIAAVDLWKQLASYARDRGWLSSVARGNQTELRFHPEVIDPLRDLLRKQHIHNELQGRALEYFERKAASLDTAESIRDVCEAVFHRFQMEGPAALGYWRDRVREAERFGPATALLVAADITGKDYAEAETIPNDPVASPEMLTTAHATAADLVLQREGIKFLRPENMTDFRRHVELAVKIAGKDSHLAGLIPDLLRTLHRAGRERYLMGTRRWVREGLAKATDPRDRFFLDLYAGFLAAAFRSSDAPAHYREALSLLQLAERTGIRAAEIHLQLADFYEFQGAHTAVVEAYRQARFAATGDPPMRAKVVEREALYALAVGDLATARQRLFDLGNIPAELRPSPAATAVLEARAALQNHDPLGAIKAAEEGLSASPLDHDRARSLDQKGEAEALLYHFGSALDAWDSASTSYDLARVSAGSARCAVLGIRMKATVMGRLKEAESMIVSASALPGARDAQIYSELELLRALVAYRMEDRAAAATIRSLSEPRTPEWPPLLRAKVLLFGAAFGLLEPSPANLDEILETFSDIQPATLREAPLELVAWSKERIDVPAEFVHSLMSLLGRSQVEAGPGSASGALRYVWRAELYRVFGQVDAAAEQLVYAEHALRSVTVPDIGLLVGWQLNLARRRLGQPTDFCGLHAEWQGSGLAGSGIHDALSILAADEAVKSRQPERARTLLESSPGTLSRDIPSVFEAERLVTLAALAGPGQGDSLRSAAAAIYRSLGQEREAVSLEGHRVSPDMGSRTTGEVRAIDDVTLTAAPWPDLSGGPQGLLETTVDGMIDNWFKFVSETLTNLLHLETAIPTRVRLQLPGLSAALPFELAPNLMSCEMLSRVIDSPVTIVCEPVAPERPGAVRIVRPEAVERELNFESSSGGTLEQVYVRHGLEPRVSFNPDPERLAGDLGEGPPPVMIHINAALRETAGGIFLDFESSSRRAETWAVTGGPTGDRKVADLTLGVSRIDRIFAGLAQPPFVMLDIAHPYNQAEAIRMLLLRNLFASQLFQLGHVRGILAGGLAVPNERLFISEAFVEAILSNTLGQAFMRPRLTLGEYYSSQPLDSLLPRFGAALWTNNPDDRLFVRAEAQAR